MKRVATPLIISPTGKGIRNDPAGWGHFGSIRNGHPHPGIDFLCDPGQEVISPINGIALRLARPYPDGRYSGILIVGESVHVKMFYLEPDFVIKGQTVEQGQFIGIAQDITERYPGLGMKPHIHLEIQCDPEYFMAHMIKDMTA